MKIKTVNLKVLGMTGMKKDQDFENIDVPLPKILENHWKVGDNMGKGPTDPNGFGIGNIAIVRTKIGYDIQFYDINGKMRGKIPTIWNE